MTNGSWQMQKITFADVTADCIAIEPVAQTFGVFSAGECPGQG